MAVALGVTTLSVKVRGGHGSPCGGMLHVRRLTVSWCARCRLQTQLMQLVEEEKSEGDWREEPLTEKLQDVMPLLIALGSYIGKILVQFQYVFRRSFRLWCCFRLHRHLARRCRC